MWELDSIIISSISISNVHCFHFSYKIINGIFSFAVLVILRGGNIQFRPTIFTGFAFAQFFLKFQKKVVKVSVVIMKVLKHFKFRLLLDTPCIIVY